MLSPYCVTFLVLATGAVIAGTVLLVAWAATVHDRRVHTMTSYRPQPRMVRPVHIPADTGRHHLTAVRSR